eukprot:3706104-Alexandrium_andersonii.AAC.1
MAVWPSLGKMRISCRERNPRVGPFCLQRQHDTASSVQDVVEGTSGTDARLDPAVDARAFICRCARQ